MYSLPIPSGNRSAFYVFIIRVSMDAALQLLFETQHIDHYAKMKNQHVNNTAYFYTVLHACFSNESLKQA